MTKRQREGTVQFVPGGPAVPEELLREHEKGRVVFFCGAGVSRPAGLPNFKDLVHTVYDLVGIEPSGPEHAAISRNEFDVALGLLEEARGRAAVRKHLAEALTPERTDGQSTELHEALLRLGHNREGELRLVTTNFDRLFIEAAERSRQALETFSAPMLPVPKPGRWDGLVHLHGLLDAGETSQAALSRLIVTSGDFGQAYLTDRWAARFVSELFRNFSVCFVGYSINDRVLRYMMDALAVDPDTRGAWAMGGFEPGREECERLEWKAKKVTPILYQVCAADPDHSALRRTLWKWAETYRDAAEGKARLVDNLCSRRPDDSTPQDDFVGRMLWAIKDPSGLSAKHFAESDPVPVLAWLPRVFSDRGISREYLFRPPPTESGMERVVHELVHWLMLHLGNPQLILWLAHNGGRPDDPWSRMIGQHLDRLDLSSDDSKAAKLDARHGAAPAAVPDCRMRRLWRLLLRGRVKRQAPGWSNHGLYLWMDDLKRNGLTVTSRLALRELLEPKVVFSESFRRADDDARDGERAEMRPIVGANVVLTADQVRLSLKDIPAEPWATALPELLEDFQQLLRDTLDLLSETTEATGGPTDEESHIALPSISPHPQNCAYADWVALVELTRDAWLAVLESDSDRATRVAVGWFDESYPTFKRLALFAARRNGCIAPEQWVDWLLADGAWWLWCRETRREVCRLLVQRGQDLSDAPKRRLEAALLDGPPESMYGERLERDRWDAWVFRETWLRLAKLQSSKLVLGEAARAHLDELSVAHPDWNLPSDASDEFPFWMTTTDDEIYDIDIAPRSWRELVPWLRRPLPATRPFCKDTWHDVCTTRFFHSLCALHKLASDGVWPRDRWREALSAWSGEGLVLRSWRWAGPLVLKMEDPDLMEIAVSVTAWIKSVAKASQQADDTVGHRESLLGLCQRILDLPLSTDAGFVVDGEPPDPVFEAINHPIGQVAQTLLDLWVCQTPSDREELPAEFKALFKKLCDVRVDRFKHGRVLLGSRAITLFRVDPAWSTKHLLPLFAWKNPDQARGVWRGFLWSPRLYEPLLVALKPELLRTAHHYKKLGDSGREFSTLLTHAALGRTAGYAEEDFRSVFDSLPVDGLEFSAEVLYRALQADERPEDYWERQIRPFWKRVWPKRSDRVTPQITRPIAHLTIAAESKFPDALATLEDWLHRIEHPDLVVHQLSKTEHCTEFPEQALHFLDKVIGDGPLAVIPILRDCVDRIEKARPSLAGDSRLRRLRILLTMSGG